jgi:hypothetical protein
MTMLKSHPYPHVVEVNGRHHGRYNCPNKARNVADRLFREGRGKVTLVLRHSKGA